MTDEATREQLHEDRRLRRMSFWKHLDEFRRRLMRVVVVVVAGSFVGLIFTRQVIAFLLLPLGDITAVALHPTESIVSYFRVALMIGIVIGMPYLVYQLLAFIAPGLNRSERGILIRSVISIGIFFFIGVVFAGAVIIPLAVGYLSQFLDEMVVPTYSIEGYISFVTSIMISTGLVFETPLVMALLARLGLVTSKTLARRRRVALLGIAVLAAVITPTPDAFNMLLVMGPLLLLYELGIFFAWNAERARRKALAASSV